MKNERNFLTSGDIERALGMNRHRVHTWIKQGILKPERDGTGTGYTGRYSVRDVLAIAVGLNLRGRGFSTPQAGRVVNLILSRPLDSFKSDWAIDRKLMVVVGDKVHPRLLTHEAVYQNPAIDMPAMFACGLPVAVIDTQAAYRLLMERLTETREQPERANWLISQLSNDQQVGGVLTT